MLMLLLLAGCAQPINERAFRDMVYTLSAPEMEGRDAGSAGLALARDYLVEQFKDAGLKPAFVIDGEPSYTQPFDLRVGVDPDGEVVSVQVENVAGVLPGVGELAKEVVVVGAHYDHVGFGDIGARDKDRKGELHPGADDNASGTAGVVLLARHFAEIERGPDTPRRTIVFACFSGEERGLRGSRFMTTHPEQWAFDGEAELSAMINMDMIGRLRADELYVFADASGEQWRDWTEKTNESIGLSLKWDVRPPGGSDHSMFIAAGVPAVFFNTFIHDDYHTPDDTPDKVNAAGGVKILKLVAALLDYTATVNERVVYVAPKPTPPRPYLGVKMANADAGVLLEEVPDGPMQKAGAKAGDMLVSLAGKTMQTPGDVRALLTQAKPGDEVEAVVLRDGERVTLKVRLDIRR